MSFFFFFNDTATTEIYTLSLHDALPILILVYRKIRNLGSEGMLSPYWKAMHAAQGETDRLTPGRKSTVREHNIEGSRSEEHTSELQSRLHLVCRLLLEKKKSSLLSNYTR